MKKKTENDHFRKQNHKKKEKKYWIGGWKFNFGIFLDPKNLEKRKKKQTCKKKTKKKKQKILVS